MVMAWRVGAGPGTGGEKLELPEACGAGTKFLGRKHLVAFLSLLENND